MKKAAVIACIIAPLLLLSACGGNDLAEQAANQGMLSLASGDYRTALKSMKLAVNKGCKDNEIINTADALEKYINAKQYMENGEVENADHELSLITIDYSEYMIAEDINTLRETIKNITENSASAYKKISEAASLIVKQNYYEAKYCLESMNGMYLDKNEKQQVEQLEKACDTALERLNNADIQGKMRAQAEIAANRQSIKNGQ